MHAITVLSYFWHSKFIQFSSKMNSAIQVTLCLFPIHTKHDDRIAQMSADTTSSHFSNIGIINFKNHPALNMSLIISVHPFPTQYSFWITRYFIKEINNLQLLHPLSQQADRHHNLLLYIITRKHSQCSSHPTTHIMSAKLSLVVI